MKPARTAATALVCILAAAAPAGNRAADPTEYESVYEDGPDSHIPAAGFSHAWPETAALEAIGTPLRSEVEARMTAALLDMLAGDPAASDRPEAPLDGPAMSDTALMMAGL